MNARVAELKPSSRAGRSRAASPDKGEVAEWQLRLYVAGQTAKSVAAFDNLKRVCETHLAGRYTIEVIDLLVSPQLAAGDQILAVPTLVRRLPPPIKRIIGNLSDVERVLRRWHGHAPSSGSAPAGRTACSRQWWLRRGADRSPGSGRSP